MEEGKQIGVPDQTPTSNLDRLEFAAAEQFVELGTGQIADRRSLGNAIGEALQRGGIIRQLRGGLLIEASIFDGGDREAEFVVWA